ncbi:helix-turn-helix transcriptional regulator [Variovorax sp. dw_308]|uniref:helix-turn-helix transcriptional regulator n=1 Tax=Variovorax sp. dw_308 TaxID=2721546 RepID=UPI002108E265|nr:helix-turn-helix transcriptional regulator [Variovorax sp. dw_308]
MTLGEFCNAMHGIPVMWSESKFGVNVETTKSIWSPMRIRPQTLRQLDQPAQPRADGVEPDHGLLVLHSTSVPGGLAHSAVTRCESRFVPYTGVHKSGRTVTVAGMRGTQDKELLKAFASEVKSRRTEAEMSQDDLAYESDLARSFVAKLEVATTSPSLTTLFRLAYALKVEPEVLIVSVKQRYLKERAAAKRASKKAN